MPHVSLPPELPGIVGLMAAHPAAAKHLAGLAQELLRGESTLAPGERELIAAYVSKRNDCTFCAGSHAAAARHLLGGDSELVAQALSDPTKAPISDTLKALLRIAGQVRESGHSVTSEAVDAARQAGAKDREIHDTVLIAAAFCMFNRYVDGLATWTPEDDEAFDSMGASLAAEGYIPPGG